MTTLQYKKKKEEKAMIQLHPFNLKLNEHSSIERGVRGHVPLKI